MLASVSRVVTGDATRAEPRIELSAEECATFRRYRLASVVAFYMIAFFGATFAKASGGAVWASLGSASAAVAFCFIDGVLYGRYYSRSFTWLMFFFYYLALPVHVLSTRGRMRGYQLLVLHGLVLIVVHLFGRYAGGDEFFFR